MFSYSIVNTGHDKDEVEQILRKVMEAASSKAASALAGLIGGAIGGPAGGGIGMIGTKALGWLSEKLEYIVFANCDGTVAAADHGFTGSQLAEATANGRAMTQTDENRGTDSPWGCGSNSHYFVTWSVSGQAAVNRTA